MGALLLLARLLRAIGPLTRAVKGSSKSEVQCPRPQEGPALPAPTRRSGTPGIVVIATLTTAVATIASAIYIGKQTQVAAGQLRASQAVDRRQQELEDLRLVSQLSVTVLRDELTIRNTSNLPLLQAAVTTYGISIDAEGNTSLDTARVPLAGLGACRSLSITGEELTDYLRSEDKDASAAGGPKPPVEDALLTVRGPSGFWYTVTSSGQVERLEGDFKDAVSATRSTSADLLLADTIAEGTNRSRFFTTYGAELGAPGPFTAPGGIPALPGDACSG